MKKDGKPQLGHRKLIKGEKNFFLMPGERTENGIEPVYILAPEDALLVRAKEGFVEEIKTRRGTQRRERKPGGT